MNLSRVNPAALLRKNETLKVVKYKITLDIIDLKDEQGEARGTKMVFAVPV
jgi:hypothetical protein